MNATWMMRNNFKLAGSHRYKLYTDAGHRLLHAHVSVDFTNEQMASCQVHGAIRRNACRPIVRMRIPKTKEYDQSAVNRAVWIYSVQTLFSRFGAGHREKEEVTLSDLKAACEALYQALQKWEHEISLAGCKILPPRNEIDDDGTMVFRGQSDLIGVANVGGEDIRASAAATLK